MEEVARANALRLNNDRSRRRNARTACRMREGHFGPYGGQFVPETLMHPLEELTAAYDAARRDQQFQQRA